MTFLGLSALVAGGSMLGLALAAILVTIGHVFEPAGSLFEASGAIVGAIAFSTAMIVYALMTSRR
jgi:hypothetical protein